METSKRKTSRAEAGEMLAEAEDPTVREVRLPVEMWAQIERMAARGGVTASVWIERQLRHLTR